VGEGAMAVRLVHEHLAERAGQTNVSSMKHQRQSSPRSAERTSG
jgi:hypothetical protein